MTVPLVQSATFIRATRDSGYQTTAHAIAELIDNALQAKATQIDVIVRNDATGDGGCMVAVVDNGIGMGAERMTLALQFGGSTRFGDRRGAGRFGMGLPNASVSQAKRVDLYSWIEAPHALYTYLDTDDVARGDVCGVTLPVAAPLPEWLGVKGPGSGTAVIWTKCDRIPYKRPGMLVRHLERELGRIFRRFLDDTISLRVNGECVTPGDVLKRGGIPERVGRPTLFPVLEFLFSSDTSPTGYSVVRAEFALLPVSEWASLPNDIKRARGISSTPTVSILRADREIAYGWMLMGDKKRENYDDWWRCEVWFEPYLDDLFGVTNNKQGIRPTRSLLDAISPSLESHARWLNRQVRDIFTSLRTEAHTSSAIATRGHQKFQATSPVGQDYDVTSPSFSRYFWGTQASDNPAFFSSSKRDGCLCVYLNSHHPVYRLFYSQLAKEGKDLTTRFELLVLALARVMHDDTAIRVADWERIIATWSDVAAVLLDEVR